MEAFNRRTRDELERILDSDGTELTKLVQTFDWTTRRIIEMAEYEIDLARAMQDDTSVIKHQIKANTLRMVRDVFQGCYLQVTGERQRLWEE